jgi:tetratricopeptide (TPR) repeat protein
MKRTKKVLSGLFLAFAIHAQSQQLADAVKYIDNEQYTRAKSTLNSIIKANPTKGDAYYQLGLVYLQIEKIDSALVSFNKAKEVDPKFNLAFVGVGNALYQKGDKAGAKSSFDQALLLTKSKNAEVLARIAEVYVEAKDKKEVGNAITLLDKAILLNKLVPDYFVIRGDAYLLKQDGSKAVADYHEAIRLAPKVAKAYIKEGKLYIKARNYDEALKYYNKGIEMNPEYSPAYREKGELYARARKYPLAIESYKKYMELSDNDDDTKFRYASFLFMTQDYKASKDLINQLFLKGYANKTGYRLLGYSDLELGDSISSVKNMEAFFKQQTDTSKYIPSDYVYYGKALIKTGQKESGLKNMVKGYQMDTTNADILLEIADNYNKLKDYPNAIVYYEKSAKKFKPRFNELYNLGRAYYFEKRYAEADTTFGSIIANYPKYPYGYTWKANTKAVMDPDSKLGLAKPYFEKVVDLFSPESAKYKTDLAKAHNYLGAYYQLVAKDKTKAAENWNKLLAYEPDNKQAKDALLILNQKQ